MVGGPTRSLSFLREDGDGNLNDEGNGPYEKGGEVRLVREVRVSRISSSWKNYSGEDLGDGFGSLEGCVS